MTPRSWTRAAALVTSSWILTACAVAPGVEAATADSYLPSSTRADLEQPSGGIAAGYAKVEAPLFGALFRDEADQDPADAGGPEPVAAAARLMVRTAELQVEVARAQDAIASCEQLTDAHGGYVSRRDGTTLVCRVPATRFDEFVAAIRATGRVLHESMQALDVTDQHRDLRIRLDNAKTSRDRLLVLLDKAEEVEDLLKIENELRRLTDEIERLTAELQNLDSRVALSTVQVTFADRANPEQDRTPVRRPSRFWWINTVGAEHVLRRF